MVIMKGRNFNETGWFVYHKDATGNTNLMLKIAQQLTARTFSINTCPTSTVFSVGAAVIDNKNNGGLLFCTCRRL